MSRVLLSFREGRLFPPAEFAEVIELVHQSPQTQGLSASRWTLAILRGICAPLHDYTLAGVYYVLHRLGIKHKQGQPHYSSPDPDYQTKVALIKACLDEVKGSKGEAALLYADEMTYFRQPSLAKVWFPKGNNPRAEYSYRRNNKSRVIGTLDSMSGKVVAAQQFKAGVEAWVKFLKIIREAYPTTRQIYLVFDNWPIHSKPKVVEAARENRVSLLYLPTYAPWLNPIEKLWRWVRQKVIHMHKLSDQWGELEQQVAAFFKQFAHGSLELLHYVGLLPY